MRPTPPARGRERAGSQPLAVSQHHRLLLGAVCACASTGTADVCVEDIIRQAGMSRRTFYDLFSDAEECVLAALQAGYAQIDRAVHVGCDAGPQGAWAARVRGALVEALGLLDAQPDLAQLCLVHARGGGERAVDAHQAFLASVAQELQAAARAGHARDAVPAELVGVLVGAILALVTQHASSRGSGSLQQLVAPLMHSVCVVYQGPQAAARESRRPPDAPKRHWTQPLDLADTSRPVVRAAAVRPELASRALLCLVATPGASNTQIARHLGISSKTIARHLAWLADLGLVTAHHPTATRNSWQITPAGHDALRKSTDSHE